MLLDIHYPTIFDLLYELQKNAADYIKIGKFKKEDELALIDDRFAALDKIIYSAHTFLSRRALLECLESVSTAKEQKVVDWFHDNVSFFLACRPMTTTLVEQWKIDTTLIVITNREIANVEDTLAMISDVQDNLLYPRANRIIIGCNKMLEILQKE